MSKPKQRSDDNIVVLPRSDHIRAQAAAWLVALERDHVSDKDRADFKRWLRVSDRHREAFEELSMLWADLAILQDLEDVAEAAPAPKRQFFSRRALVSTAALFFVVAVGVVFFHQGEWFGLSGKYQTIVGEQQTVELADGSVIQLNTDSHVVIEFTRSRRVARLISGEAHFDVANNVRRPFSVLTAGGVVNAVGTAFAVRLHSDNSIHVTVEEGRVDIAALSTSSDEAAAPDGAVPLARLSAGQHAIFGAQVHEIARIAEPELKRRLSWRQGVLVYSGDPLAKVIADVSRYTDMTIEISAPELGGMPVAGYFRVGEVDALFEALELSFGLKVERIDDKHVRLSEGP